MTTLKKALIFNIQRYSIHDGPGIRTIIFFQGCPLRCPWCCNPESQGAVVPQRWIKNGQEEIISHWMTVEEVLQEIEKDEIFYRSSNGGVTLSGGECLLQADFCSELLQQIKEMGINTAIETTGAVKLSAVKQVLPYVDYAMFDLKIMDPLVAKKVIGDSVLQVKKSFETLLNSPNVTVIPRVPLIPGYTTSSKNLHQIAAYVHEVGIKEIHILPFHQYGSKKYEYLQRNYAMQDAPLLTQDQIDYIQTLFENENIKVVLNGLE